MSKPIISVDFDGVLHGYSSGWKGPRTIPDPPVPGAIDFLLRAVEHFEVHIFSSRSRYLLGRRSMKLWLLRHMAAALQEDSALLFDAMRLTDHRHCMEAHPHDTQDTAHEIVCKRIRWPRFKPPALLTIDDRALCFDGTFPTIAEIKSFKPWNRQ